MTTVCVCEREWSGEAMLCCDACERWFHPECVGVSKLEYSGHTAGPAARWKCTECCAAEAPKHGMARPQHSERNTPNGQEPVAPAETAAPAVAAAAAAAAAAAPAATAAAAQPANAATVAPSPTGEPLFCVCEQPWRGEEMLACDSCDGWFHPLCQDMSDVEYLRLFAPESFGIPAAETPPKWTCCACRVQNVTAAAAALSKCTATNQKSAAKQPNIATAGDCNRGDVLVGSRGTSDTRATRWPVGRRRSKLTSLVASVTQQPRTVAAHREPSLSLSTRGGASKKQAAESATCAGSTSRSTTSSTNGRLAITTKVDGFRVNGGRAATHRRGSLPGAREEGSGGIAWLARGQGNFMPEWWEEDLRRLAQEERQRQQQRQPKRKRHKLCQRDADAQDPDIIEHNRASSGAYIDGRGDKDSKGDSAVLASVSADDLDLPQCPICLCMLSSDNKRAEYSSGSGTRATAQTPCSHVFCRSCLMAALTRCHGPPRCPLCRRDLSRFLVQLQRSAVVKVDLF